MKKTILSLAIGALLLTGPQLAKSADVSFDFFYNNLSSGSWIEVGDYGYCWQPDVGVSDRNWRPYSDGYWTYTDLGWTWVSYEDFGWATYHYGRWVRLDDYGWVWTPGRDSELEWGPAWVSWRTGGDYIGWAPLPPEVTITGGPVITGTVDADYDIGPAYYNFVEIRYIGEPVLRERIVPVTQNVTYITQTVNVTNITVRNGVVYNYGPDFNVVNQHAARPIQRLKLERQENVDVASAARSGALTKVQGDKLVVAAPMTIKRPAQLPPPPAVKAKVAQPKIDKGWSVVSDPKVQTELRQKIKTEDRNKAQVAGGAVAQPSVNVSASPGAGAAAAGVAAGAATQANQGRGQGRHGQRGTVGADASPAPATSPAGGFATEAAGGQGGRRGQDRHNRFPQEAGQNAPAGSAAAAEASGAENGMPHNRQGRHLQSQPGESSPGDMQGQGAGGQGRQGGRFQGQPVESAPGDMQGQGGGARHQQEGPQGAGQGGQGGHPQGQGEGQGHHGKKGQGEGSPAPTPQ